MIFTRRFGALRALQTFPHHHEMDLAEYEARRKAEYEQHKAAKAVEKTARNPRPSLRHRSALRRHGHS